MQELPIQIPLSLYNVEGQKQQLKYWGIGAAASRTWHVWAFISFLRQPKLAHTKPYWVHYVIWCITSYSKENGHQQPRARYVCLACAGFSLPPPIHFTHHYCHHYSLIIIVNTHDLSLVTSSRLSTRLLYIKPITHLSSVL